MALLYRKQYMVKNRSFVKHLEILYCQKGVREHKIVFTRWINQSGVDTEEYPLAKRTDSWDGRLKDEILFLMGEAPLIDLPYLTCQILFSFI